ncbi:M1 family aminopeptidase [Hymenobacter sp. BT770]|uniref:M1 family aminopeptidase n=1 Tax=Hymenobacter sp. BT770 TaxID=2886942 RepID=UPI001D127749|nr:M1 family aminopeptidase [Hymenobacter sp. BT770]MCC3152273.1 HEAT repeat domain-containing protein [Hymenobacter sp. BT770]MDO3414086.1 M1 family aminopeptidase [Hymenobacter sp. BT770]
MKHLLALGLLGLVAAAPALAQPPTTPAAKAESPYRASATKINDLVHTKLDVRFDYAKRYLYGKEWVTLKPHAYPTDSLRLDAKGMDIKTVALMNGDQQQPLKYTYTDAANLRINLGKTYKPGEQYTIYIDYTSKPDELKVKGSAAITDAKGLYFINPDSAVAGKPVQIWTQGETEGSSAWFPTIDRPNQKTTEEISMTVPSKYVTLSNGALVSQKPAGPGLRTDTWKMDLPHSPYLFMMAVGDFRITKDTWRGKEVSYYLEPKYAPFAKQIFGNTPDMLEFFSNRLGVEYPWNKYAQIVARDYVSGAMENTTATLHGEQVQLTDRELLDREYGGESVIAHELFHQWFGDYVTAESWANITVNETMADFSEGLYAEHKYGKDAADAHYYRYLRRYLSSPRDATKTLVRFHYDEQEEVFDLVSYQKGGAIMDMLRTYLGDDVFFAGLQKYLKDNALGNGEAHQMRLAFEAVSGQDLNWFYNQWYFAPGHPVVTIDYAWDAAKKVQSVTVKQTQPGQVFQLPFVIDYYVGGKVQHQPVTMTEATQTFTMPLAAKPELVNVDANKKTLWIKTDNKPVSESVYQYSHAPLFVDRREAVEAAAKVQTTDAAARKMLLAALNDKFYSLRIAAIEALKMDDKAVAKAAAPALRKLATKEKDPAVLSSLLTTLAKAKDKKDEKFFSKQLNSQSYNVQGAALRALAAVKPSVALLEAKKYESDSHAALAQAVTEVYAKNGTLAQWPYVRDKFDAARPQGKLNLMAPIATMLGRLDDPTALSEGITRLKDLGVKYKSYGADKPIIGLLQGIVPAKAGRANAAEAQQAVEKAVAEIQAAK